MAIVAVVVAVVVHSSPEAVVKPPFSHIDNISGLTQIVVGVKFRESAEWKPRLRLGAAPGRENLSEGSR